MRLRSILALFSFVPILSGTLIFFSVRLHDALDVCLINQQVPLLVFELKVIGVYSAKALILCGVAHNTHRNSTKINNRQTV